VTSSASCGRTRRATNARTASANGRIERERRRARVEAGARWDDVVPRASELGLPAPEFRMA
jgi:UDP-N-acetylenolpyruvoylglucosamine reductase